ncbi:ribosomal RNA adenine methylase transferase [Gottschalkia acidurici 9a]|uniref:Ribosomal RNA adenine methylase transferase n=1 Tax=Gottschalkia acidurici (strain ATCC 7906 / DSM 604 / BCRC 14475 / CIP 104303 / KCTC 5404 / NCIMB 10678 / 9a) TaxID=1128398 RepID=K0AXU0_GOTA9|nr:rRNA adenine N-6-methyltransferase family protein [Gottschalkia acidurici]AFS77560.1 ribosomal RNA adenine methylase transferase [Gottschalkia acidurici 9a]
MKLIKFLVEYIKSPRTVGAVAPSSERLAVKMVADMDFKNTKCIVEYGSGTGVFTDKLVERKNKDTLLILLEYNKGFCKQLEDRYSGNNNIIIINDSAENVYIYLKKYNIKKVDYVVSGLPFASLPKSISNKILKKTKTILKKDGLFITFQYTLLKKEFIANYFKEIELKRVVLNVPPAYVLKCKNF